MQKKFMLHIWTYLQRKT
uniref:Uncharacterized protein n=1 Tax=Rhizophora mucronata TaxID=61149 RepID=A0A2P2NCG9_RHIMU